MRAAREALSREHLAQPGRRGDREAMRVLLTTRAGTIRGRTKAICQLKALIVGAPEPLLEQLRRQTTDAQFERCSRLRTLSSHSVEHHCTIRALRICARQALFLEAQAADLGTELEELVTSAASWLLAQRGVRVLTAAQVLVSRPLPADYATKRHSRPSPESPRSPPPAGTSPASGSTEEETAT